MNISINCKLSLSKKLRAILGKEATLTLVSQDIVDGKGTAIISLDSEDISDQINISEIGETSIMLTPVEMADESPNNESITHSSIFSTIPQKHQTEKLIEKIAVVNPPEKGQESKAIKKEAEIPKEFSHLKSNECRSWIRNMEDLAVALNKAKNKKSTIDVNSARNERERIVLQEAKEKEEAIDESAWIVNDKVGNLSINDLDISLQLNSPYNLSNISARKLSNSKDLRALSREGYIRFISPEEKDRIIMESGDEEERNIGLDVFDDHEAAMDNIENPTDTRIKKSKVINEKYAMDITEDNMNDATEEEDMIINLTKSLPPIKKTTISPEGKKTVHGNHKTITNQTSKPAEPSKAHKTIRKLD